MLGVPKRDRTAERRAATRREIIDAAWEVAREKGLAQLTLRDVAERVGMKAPSLYSHVDSKHAIYDAMFAQGNRQLLQRLDEQDWPDDPRELLRVTAHIFVEFSAEDVARYQLMFQRTIPDFEPSPESYALAMQVVDQMRSRFAVAGLTDPADFDLGTALISGLAAQQTANEPGGDRWMRLTDDAVDMFVDHVFAKNGPRRQ